MSARSRSRSTIVLVASLAAVILAPTLSAGDWPGWRGPHRDGISTETGLLGEWPEGGPKLVWQSSGNGGGYSTPAVADGRVIVLGSEGSDSEFVRALSVKDGAEIWMRTIGKVGKPDQRPSYPGSRSTVAVDGGAVYAFGSDGDLACLDAKTGEVRWTKNVREEFGGESGTWAYAESPLVDGDVVVVTPGGSEATIACFEKATGKVVWKSAVPGGDQAGYASLVVAEIGGVKQYVQFLQKGVVGVDAKTGKFLWRYGKTAEGSPANIPTPVVHGDLVYSGAGRSGGGLVKVTAKDGEFTTEEKYFTAKMPTSIGGAVRIGDHLYGTTREGLLCAKFDTADVAWQARSVGAGSLVAADGRLYIHGENGEVALVEATPEEYREKGRFTPPNGPERGSSKAWAYPVISDGRMYIRDLGAVWCFEVAGK